MESPWLIAAMVTLLVVSVESRDLPESLARIRGTGQQELLQEMQQELPAERSCPQNCSSVGPCVAGTCICPPHFGGDDCSIEMDTCPNFCSGRGQCTAEDGQAAACKCDQGFTGADCSTVVAVCPLGCSDKGLCIEGVCYCDSEWAGPGCQERLMDTHVHADDTVNSGPEHPIASATLWLPLAETPAMFVFKTWPDLQKKLAILLGKSESEIGLVRALPQADTDANGTRTGGVAATVAVMCNEEDKRTVLSQLHESFGAALQPVDQDVRSYAHDEALGAVSNVQLGLSATFPGTMAGGLLRGIKARQIELVQTQTMDDDDDSTICDFNCNLHGTCNEEHAICVCDDGWYGSYCFTQNECDAGCTDPMVCNAAGDACECPAGFDGAECEVTLCDPADCSGHGTCTNGACVCHTGWTGDKCDLEMLCTGTPLCSTPNGTCSRVGMQYICTCNDTFHGSDCHAYLPCIRNCSSNGVCDRGTCICDQGWQGQDCSSQMTCAHNCSGNGNCVLGKCACNAGWSFYDCSRMVTNCPASCSYQGNCVGDVCQCYQGFTGAACNETSVTTDFGCPANCSGRGVCVAGRTLSRCECNLGWTGTMCTIEDIPCPNACSGLGSCGVGGVCNCVPGRTGSDCSKVVMGHDMDLCAHNCSGKGTCVLGACICMTGYSGTDCSVRSLACEFGCSGKGECVAGECVCDNGFDGSACQSPAQAMYRCANNCSGHGECIGEVCRCRPGYMGTDCRREMHCPHNCSGHGLCVSGQCVCRPGFGGNDKCVEDSPTDCSQTVAVCVNNCSGHGQCMPETGSCSCDSGYTGIDCSSSVGCPFNCSGHGLCSHGVCKCQLGFTGSACSRALTGCATECAWGTICNSSVCVSTDGYTGPGHLTRIATGDCQSTSFHLECSGHGRCIDGECVCKAGYYGADCSLLCANNCSNTDCEDHGVCMAGECVCINNYTGTTCETKVVPEVEEIVEVEDDVVVNTSGTVVNMASHMVGELPVLVQTSSAATESNGDALTEIKIPHIEHPLRMAPEVLAEHRPKMAEPRPQHPSAAKMAEINHNLQMVPNARFLPPTCAGNCSGVGECVKMGPVHTVGKCSCDLAKGLGGHNCDEKVKPCSNHCSGSGWCNFTTGTCECDHLFFGADCSQGHLSQRACLRNCSGNGICHSGHCSCNRRTSGHDCSITCPGGCSGNGVCVNGECVCTLHFHGDDCATYQPPSEPSPGTHIADRRREAAKAPHVADPFDEAFAHVMEETVHNHVPASRMAQTLLVNMLEIEEGKAGASDATRQ